MNLPLWTTKTRDLNPRPDANLCWWLEKPYVLSRAFKQHCQTLEVELLDMRWTEPQADERTYLDCHTDQHLVRQIHLCADSSPWSFARVIIPKPTYNANQYAFDHLGEGLIGETLLYNNPKMQRSAFEFAVRSRDFCQTNFPLLKPELYHHFVFARRSRFVLDGLPLIISEYFLKDLPQVSAY
jgi:chorismate-pyruvate lyase